MPDFENERLEIFEKYIKNLPKETSTSHGDFVFTDFTKSVAIDDGYREADMLIEVTIGNIDRTIVLMASKIEDGKRNIVDDVEDEEALKRARRYAANIENGSYYGLTNGKEIFLTSIDPDIKFKEKNSIEKISSSIEKIILEERRIKDSNEFVKKLKQFHDEIEPYIHKVLQAKLKNDKDFEDRIRRFLVPIGQSYDEGEVIPQKTLEMLSMQATYLLIDKVLFYYLILENEKSLRKSLKGKKYDEIFKKLKRPGPKPNNVDKKWSKKFWDYLENIFNLIKKINYSPVFDPINSPLNEMSLDSEPTACYTLKELTDYLYGKERLSSLFDGPLLSKIYEGLIPPELRWKWGQIYTPPEVTRFITRWAIRNPEDNVLDPACGTGRFLISSYEILSELKKVELGEKHQEIVGQIKGIDINQFPAHLATMSLVSMNLGSFTEEVDIRVRDFFRFKGRGQTNFSPKISMVELTGQTKLGRKGDLVGQSTLKFGKSVSKIDAIVMNPPYTREEALGKKYKKFVRSQSLSNLETLKKGQLNANSGFYVYFMIHGTKFLKKNGRFGMIVQNSWLDVDYGKDVQKFLLNNYKIKAIIGTQKHRLIKTADVNTVIVLLEREDDENKRKKNVVKFVQLRNDVEWFEQNYGFDELIAIINSKKTHSDNDIRIISRSQKELYEEALVDGEYIGGKWGKFIRAPDIFFKIEKKIKKMERLRHYNIDSYLNTGGADKFFFVREVEKVNGKESEIENLEFNEKFIVECKFLKPLLKSPQGITKPTIEPEITKDLRILVIPQQKTHIKNFKVYDYIKFGEKKEYNKRSGRKNKKPWWKPPKRSTYTSEILLRRTYNENHMVFYNPKGVISNRFYRIKNDKGRLLAGILNSSITSLFFEVLGNVNLGQGALEMYKNDYARIPLVDINEFDKKINKNVLDDFLNRKMKNIFEEIGANKIEDVALDKVKKDRREIDKTIMEDIMNLSKKEQLEIYRGVIDLVKNRIDKAKSAK